MTSRSVWPSPLRSAATQPFPWTAGFACDRPLTSAKRPPPTFSKRALRGSPPFRLPSGGVRVGVRVDDEEVESAVVVVVQPAEAASHHRVDVIGGSEAEVVLREVHPGLPCNVGETDPGEPLRGRSEQRSTRFRRRNDRDRPAAADMRNEPAAFRSHLQLECLVQRCWRLPSDQGAPGPRIARKLHRACQPGNRDRSALAVTRFEMDVHLIDPIRRHFDRAALCRVDLASQRIQFVADRGTSDGARSPPDQGRGLRLEVGDEVGCDPACRLPAEHGLDLARRQNRHLGKPPRVFEQRDGGRGPRSGPGAGDRARVGDERHGAERDESAPVEMDARHECQQRSRCADDRERAEERHLCPELGLRRRDQQHAEQADRDRVDDATPRRLGRRLRVGDHEEQEDQDLRRGDEHPPEVVPGDRAEVPARGERVAEAHQHGERSGEGHPEGDCDHDQAKADQDRQAAADDDRER